MKRLVLAAVALAVLAGCSSTATPAAPSLPPPATTAAPGAVTPAMNARGNLVKAIGQEAGTSDDAGNQTLSFRVDAIRAGARCDAKGYTSSPENGQFIALDITAATTSYFGVQDDPNIFGYGWSVVTADGRRHQVDSGSAYGCSPSRRNLEGLGAGISVQGTILLDAPKDVAGGVVVLTPPSMRNGGWEWVIPA